MVVVVLGCLWGCGRYNVVLCLEWKFLEVFGGVFMSICYFWVVGILFGGNLVVEGE